MSDQVSKQTLILRHIKDNKKILLDKAFIALLGLPLMIDLFRKCSEISKNREGKDIFNFVCTSFHQEVEKKGKGIAQPIDKEKLSIEEYSQLITECEMIAQNMEQVSYEPPLDCDGIAMHLWVMYYLYENAPISWPPTIEDICLDFSFAKLYGTVSRKIAIQFTCAARDEPRTVKSTESLKNKKKQDAQMIIDTFFDLIYPKEAKLHKVAVMIKERLEIKYKEITSIDTIKRVLKNNPEVWKNFKEITVKGKTYFIKQM